MGLRKLIVLIVWLLSLSTAVAQQGGNASLRVAGNSQEGYVASFTIGHFSVGTGDNHYGLLQADGMTAGNGEVGKPDLPTLSTLVRLPRGSRLALSTMTGEETTWDSAVHRGWPLAPVVGAHVKNGAWPGYNPDKKTYSTDAYYRGGDAIEVKHIGTMGREEVYRVTVRPVAYNPVSGSLRFYSTLSATLELTPSELVAPDTTLPVRYLVVSRPEFGEGLQPFVQWKRQEGFEVEEIYADTNKRDVVKALIESRWEDAEGRWPGYILLVGDVAKLQSYLGTTRPEGLNNHATDLYYAEHTGDYLPDALIGRWPVNDTAELRAVVEKTLRYEQCNNLDSNMLRRALLVAGRENSNPAPTTTNGQVNYLKHRLTAMRPTMDTMCYYNPTSENQRDEILADIALGTSFVNYTAHCTTGGWSRPGVGFTTVDTLGCMQPTLYINNCCLSNSFDGTCFGELLLRKPQGGAIGVIGATNSTLWNEDYYWAVGPKHPFSLEPAYDCLHPGAFDMWLDSATATQGGLMAAGNLSVTAFGSPYDKFYWEIYCLLGDPSLRPYTGAPRTITLWVPDSLTVGATSTRISGTNGATVTAMQGGRLLGKALLDQHRSTEIRFNQALDTLPVIFTATMTQAKPVTDTTYMAQPVGLAVAFHDISVADTTVDFTLANIGNDTVFDLAVQLLCDDDSPVTFSETTQIIDTLLPASERPIHMSVNVLRWEQLWKGTLTAYGTNGYVECGEMHLHGRLGGLPPTLKFNLLTQDSVDAATIEASRNYLLRTVAEGLYDSLNVTLSALPTLYTLVNQQSMCVAGFTTPDTITHLHIEATVTRGNYRHDYDLWLIAGSRVDSFEEGCSSFPWDRNSLRPWIIDSTEHHSGAFSMRSAPIGGRQTSDLALNLSLSADDSIIFWARTSSEQNYDKLGFYIDAMHQMSLSGNTGWRRCSFPVAAGSHRLLWRYVKDDSGNTGSDCAWIDDVQMPMAQWDSVYGWFGSFAVPLAIDTPVTSLEQTPTVTPNPTNGIVTITEALSITILDLYGRQRLTCAGPVADLRALPAGSYIAVIDTGSTTVYKLIIKQ